MAEEYPRNLTELEANFGTEEAGRGYLARLRRGVEEGTTITDPPLVFVSVMEAMVMLTAVSRSDGASPIFTWRDVVFGWEFWFWGKALYRRHRQLAGLAAER